MISNSQPWDNLKFDRDGVDEVRRKFFGTLYNTYSFFALYANVDGFTGQRAGSSDGERPRSTAGSSPCSIRWSGTSPIRSRITIRRRRPV